MGDIRMMEANCMPGAPAQSEPRITIIALRETQPGGRLHLLEMKDRTDLCPAVSRPVTFAETKSTFELPPTFNKDKRYTFVKQGPTPMSMEELNGMLLRHRHALRPGVRFDAHWGAI